MFNSPISRGPRHRASSITKYMGDPSSSSDGDIWYNVLTGQLRANIGGVVTTISVGTSSVAQIVNIETGALATGTTTIPADDTIPQNTEGVEYMTLAITPKNSTNKLRIDITFVTSNTAGSATCVALFQDTTTDAIAAVSQTPAAAGSQQTITFSHFMTASTIISTTFKVRAGTAAAATLTFNGSAGVRRFGGVSASSITITEFLA